MTPVKIKQIMLARGLSQSDIASDIKKDPSLVAKVINGKSTNLAIRQGVAAAIDKPLMEVFPDEAYRRASGRIRIPSAYYQAAMANA